MSQEGSEIRAEEKIGCPRLRQLDGEGRHVLHPTNHRKGDRRVLRPLQSPGPHSADKVEAQRYALDPKTRSIRRVPEALVAEGEDVVPRLRKRERGGCEKRSVNTTRRGTLQP